MKVFHFFVSLSFLSMYKCAHHGHGSLSHKQKQLLKCAHDATQNSLDLDERRWKQGIDVSTADKTEINAEVISEHDFDLSHLVHPARMFNSLAKCIRDSNSGQDLAKLMALAHSLYPKTYSECPYKLHTQCQDSSLMKYRRTDGTCNNIANPLWGSSGTPYSRILPPLYEGNDSPRQKDSIGGDLPGARYISTTIHTVNDRDLSTKVSSLYTGFGQLIAHDVSRAPGERGYNGVPVSCCGDNPNPLKCFSINIPENDPYFGHFNKSCMWLARSAEATDLECRTGVRQQLNMVTPFLDGCGVYSADDADNVDLIGKRGLLKSSRPNHFLINKHQNALAHEMGYSLFKTGDPKITVSPQLTSSALILHRFHNIVGKTLGEINPHWDGDRLYEEAKRLVIAIYQHIVYNEYLLATLSDRLMMKYELYSIKDGYYEGYDATVDPSTSNAFASAAMRFGHSLISNYHYLADRNLTLDGDRHVLLHTAFFLPLTWYNREQDLTRGQAVTASEKSDRSFSGCVRNQLFETVDNGQSQGDGMDLPATNIQRGRDHGIRPYHEWRTYYNLAAPTNWTASSFPHHSADVIELFKKVYKSPLDIDLFTAGVSELKPEGGTVGPLFAEIIAEQFSKFKRGDRFWYETSSLPQRFEPDQLQSIRNASLAMVLCAVNDLSFIQEKPLFLADITTNPVRPCSDYATIDWSKWMDSS